MTFEEFAGSRLPGLLRYATVLTGDPHLAQDIVQDVLIRVHRRWRHIESHDQPDQYVRRAVLNAYLSWRRRWSVRHLIPFGSLPEQAGADPSVERDERSEAWQRLSALPRRQRAVLTLRFYEGMSDAEIAEAMDCAESTVRSQASRALAQLRAVMQDNHLEESR